MDNLQAPLVKEVPADGALALTNTSQVLTTADLANGTTAEEVRTAPAVRSTIYPIPADTITDPQDLISVGPGTLQDALAGEAGGMVRYPHGQDVWFYWWDPQTSNVEIILWGGDHHAPGAYYELHTWQDIRDFVAQTDIKRAVMRKVLTYDGGAKVAIPAGDGYELYRHDPSVFFEFDVLDQVSDRLQIDALCTRQTVGDTMLFSGTVPAWGGIPQMQRADHLVPAFVVNDFGGDPNHGVDAQAGRHATVTGNFGTGSRWMDWWRDGIATTVEYGSDPNSDWRWVQAAIDSCRDEGSLLKGKVEFGQGYQRADTNTYLMDRPLNFDRRYVQFQAVHGAKRDDVRFNWSTLDRWQVPGTGEYWPHAFFIACGASYEQTGESAGFNTVISGFTVDYDGSLDDEIAAVEAYAGVGGYWATSGTNPLGQPARWNGVHMFAAYDRLEEGSQIFDIEILGGATRFVFMLRSANGAHIHNIHISDAQASDKPQAAGSVQERAIFRRARRAKWFFFLDGNDTPNFGNVYIHNIETNSENGGMFYIHSNATLHAHDLDAEGVETVLFAQQDAIKGFITRVNGANQQRQWTTGANQAFTAVVQAISNDAVNGSVLTLDTANCFYNGEIVRFSSTVRPPGDFVWPDPALTTRPKFYEVGYRVITNEDTVLGLGLTDFQVRLQNRFQNGPINFAEAWVTGTTYYTGEVVDHGGVLYEATATHVAFDGGTPGVDDGPTDNEPGIGTGAPGVWQIWPGLNVGTSLTSTWLQAVQERPLVNFNGRGTLNHHLRLSDFAEFTDYWKVYSKCLHICAHNYLTSVSRRWFDPFTAKTETDGFDEISQCVGSNNIGWCLDNGDTQQSSMNGTTTSPPTFFAARDIDAGIGALSFTDSKAEVAFGSPLRFVTADAASFGVAPGAGFVAFTMKLV